MRTSQLPGAAIGELSRMAHIGNCLGSLIRRGNRMKKEQLFGIVRTVAAAGFGYLAGKGLIDGATVDLLAGAVATIGVAIWSFVSKQPITESAE